MKKLRCNKFIKFSIFCSFFGFSNLSQANEDLNALLKKYEGQNKNQTKVNKNQQSEPQSAPTTKMVPTKAKAKKVDPAPEVAKEQESPVAKEKNTPAAKPAEAKVSEVQTEDNQKSQDKETDQKESAEEFDALLGDWGGAKSGMANVGLNFGIAYIGDGVSNFAGGIEHKSGYLGNLDITLDIDFEKLLSIKGLNLVLYGLSNHGDNPTEFVGDSFATSNIEAPDSFKLYEAYFQQSIDERSTLQLGLKDLNADYYASESAGILLNSAFGISPSLSQTGLNGPSIFPVTSLAMNFMYHSENSFYFQTAAFNAQSGDPEKPYGTQITTSADEGYLLIWELGFAGGEENPFKYGLGAWTYTKEAEALGGSGDTQPNSGFYLLFDHKFTEKFSGFVHYGVATSEVNTFSASAEMGVVLNGLLPKRPNDNLFLGAAHSTASKDFKLANGGANDEAVFEVGYQINFGRGVSLTPDYQYIVNPGLSKELTDAQVGTLRIEIAF